MLAGAASEGRRRTRCEREQESAQFTLYRQLLSAAGCAALEVERGWPLTSPHAQSLFQLLGGSQAGGCRGLCGARG